MLTAIKFSSIHRRRLFVTVSAVLFVSCAVLVTFSGPPSDSQPPSPKLYQTAESASGLADFLLFGTDANAPPPTHAQLADSHKSKLSAPVVAAKTTAAKAKAGDLTKAEHFPEGKSDDCCFCVQSHDNC